MELLSTSSRLTQYSSYPRSGGNEEVCYQLLGRLVEAAYAEDACIFDEKVR